MARKKRGGNSGVAPTVSTKSNVKTLEKYNKSLGYSDESLKALKAGKYDEMTGRNPKYTRSQDQIKLTRVPALNGMRPGRKTTPTAQTKQAVKNSTKERKNYIDTTRARQKYADRKNSAPSMEFTKELTGGKSPKPVVNTKLEEPFKDLKGNKKATPVMDLNQKRLDKSIKTTKENAPKPTGVASTRRPKEELGTGSVNSRKSTGKTAKSAREKYEEYIGHTPTKGLSQEDADFLYKVFDRNRTSSGGKDAIVHQLKNNMWHSTKDWEEKYGKSVEQIVDEYAADFDKISERKDREYGEEHPVLATLKNTVTGGTAQPAIDLESTIMGKVAPNSPYTKAIRNATENYAKQKKQRAEAVTSDMGSIGKGGYDLATGLAERGIEYASPSYLKYLLQLGKTAEAERQSLKERGIDDKSAEYESLLSGVVDAGLDAIGLESIPVLKKAMKSGNVLKELAARTIVGGGEQGITYKLNELIDSLNGDKSRHAIAVQNYMAQGMTQEQAEAAVEHDESIEAAKQIASGAALNNLIGFGGRAGKKAVDAGIDALTGRNIPSLWTPSARPETVENLQPPVEKMSNLEEAESVLRQRLEETEALRQAMEENAQKLQPEMGKVSENPEMPENTAFYDSDSAEKLQTPMEKVEENPAPTWDKYEVDSIMDNDGSTKYFVVGKNKNGDMGFAEKGVYYNSRKEANAAIKAIKSGSGVKAPVEAVERANAHDVNGGYINDLRTKFENADPEGKAEMLVEGGYFRDMIEAGEAYRDGKLDAAVDDYLSKMERNGNPASSKRTVDTNSYDHDMLKNQYNGDWDAMRKGIIADYTGAKGKKAKQYFDTLRAFTGGSSPNEKQTKILDDYVKNAPTYQGQIGRGMHFNVGDGEYDKFMSQIHEGGTLTLGKPSSWATDPETTRLYSHMGDDAVDSVEIVCNQNRTSTPINYMNLQGEDEVLSSSDASWTVLREQTYTRPNGARKTVLYVAETGDVTPPRDAVVIPEADNLPTNKVDTEQPSEVASSMPENRSEITPTDVNSPLISEEVTSGDTGESRVVSNSAINAGIISRYDYENDPVLREIAEYDKHSNEKTYNAALENVKNNGAQLLDEYNTDRRLINNDTDVDQAMILLRNLNDQIKADPNSAEELTAQRNMLLSRLRKAGTQWGEAVQAFAKWNDTPDGALINGEKMNAERTKVWEGQNQDQVNKNKELADALDNIGREIPEDGVITSKTSPLMDKALRMQGNDGTIQAQKKAPKTHEQYRAEVENSLKKELGSIYKNMNETDLEYYTSLVENKVPVEQIVDEIEHRLNHGEFYTIDESIEAPKQLHSKLLSALNSLVEPDEDVPRREMSMNELRDRVRNTLESEPAKFGEFTDEDVNYIANLIQNGATKDELAQALNTKMATGRFGISEDTQTKVNQLFDIADRYDPDSKESVQAKAAAYRLIAEEVVGDASPFEKFEAWRYMAMLGNPKTMLRNFVGNTLFNATTGVSNTLSAVLEAGVDKGIKLSKKGLNKAFKTNFDDTKGIERTKSVLIPGLDHDLIKGAWNDAPAHRYAQLQGGKYEKSGVRDKIAAEKSVYNSKLMKLAEKAVDTGISDYPAIKTKYSTSLAGWMKANGLDASAFDAEPRYKNLKAESMHRVLTDTERAEMKSLKETMNKLEKGRDYAVKAAEYATFHEDNAIANALSKATNTLIRGKNATKGTRALGYMIEGVIPFKKTPANILKSGIEYSPLGAIKSIAQTGKLIIENTPKNRKKLGDTYTKKSWWRGNEKEVQRTLANEVIDSWSKSLTGTGLAMLGYYLKSKGILNSSEKDEKYQDDLEGLQNYSITINDKTYTLDWAAPAVMPLLLGAEVKKAFERHAVPDEKWYGSADEVAETINSLLDPIFETSMMQGVQNVVESAANSSRYGSGSEAVGGVAGSLAANALTGYYTQALPTIMGQVARTIDPVRRSTDVATDSSFLAGIEKQGRKLMNKTPFLSRFNTPYVDARGEQQANSPFNNVGANLAYQMLSPSYIRDIDTREADTMARNVYNATTKDEEGREVPIRDKNVFAPWKSKVTYGGEKLTPEQMYTYRTESGKAGQGIRTALAKEPWFNELDGQQQTELVKKVNTLVNKVGLEATGYPQTDKALDAYMEDVKANKSDVPSLMKYYHDEITKSNVNSAATAVGLSASSNAAKEATKAAESGNMELAQQILDRGAQDREEAMAAGYVDKDGKVLATDYADLISEAGDKQDKMRNDIPRLKELGNDKSAYHTYASAINAFPSLTPDEFTQTYNEINTDKTNKITQKELIDYINQFEYDSPEEAEAYWYGYGSNWTNEAKVRKKIRYNTNTGLWEGYY